MRVYSHVVVTVVDKCGYLLSVQRAVLVMESSVAILSNDELERTYPGRCVVGWK